MSFGFPVGSFISALELVGVVFDAIRASGKAATQYKGLLNELQNLKRALLAVKNLDVDESLFAYENALQASASQCMRTISDFWERMQKYQPHTPHLQQAESSWKAFKAGVMRIRWTLCQSDDVARFQSDLMAHTGAIQMLLGVIQMCENF